MEQKNSHLVNIRSVTSAPSKLYELKPEEIATFLPVESCPCCESKDNELVLTLGGLDPKSQINLLICRQCLHLYYDPSPSEKWLGDFYATKWDSYGRVDRPQAEILAAAPADRFTHLSQLQLPLDAKILDYGCGFGQGLHGLANQGFECLYGVEPSEHRFSIAKERGVGEVRCGGVEQVESFLESGIRFDLIISRHVIEHVREPRVHFETFHRALSPTGKLLILVPLVFTESPIGSVMFLPHLHTFSCNSMRALFDSIQLRSYVYEPSLGNELVVVGSADPLWQPHPESGFKPIEKYQQQKETITSYLRKPFIQEINKCLISYGHPLRYTSIPDGFHQISYRISLIINMVALLSFMMPSESLRRRLFVKCFSWLRRFFGAESVTTNDIITCTTRSRFSPEKLVVLKTAKGYAPVFVK